MSYGSPFGPGYAYSCYYLKYPDGAIKGFRIEDPDECDAHQNQNLECKAMREENPVRSEDPCWKL